MAAKTALVTGASRGIGRGVARGLLERGLTTIATCTRADGVAELERELAEVGGGKAVALQLDIRQPEQITRLAQQVQELGQGLDILINNAGIMDPQPSTIGTITPAGWDDVLHTNLRGPLFLTQQLLPLLQAAEAGRILNMSGMLGTFASGMQGGGNPAYRISKAGINALTLILSEELADSGVVCHAIDPGWVRTDLGGPDAPRSVSDVAAEVIAAALEPISAANGRLLRSGEPAAW